MKYWVAYVKIDSIPARLRAAGLKDLAVEPLLSQTVESGKKDDAQGLGTYGSVTHRIYWGPSVNGKSPAIMGDCLDTSRFGSLIKTTKQKVTKGLPKDNARGIFAKNSSGQWRVQNIEFLVDQAC